MDYQAVSVGVLPLTGAGVAASQGSLVAGVVLLVVGLALVGFAWLRTTPSDPVT